MYNHVNIHSFDKTWRNNLEDKSAEFTKTGGLDTF